MTDSRELIRSQIKHTRTSQSIDDINLKSQSIQNKLFSNEIFMRSDCIAFYNSLNTEVNTHNMIDKTLNIGKTVCLPRINTESKDMIFLTIEDLLTMKPNDLGILEPTNGEICTNIDVIIVPGLAFDQSGNRLGFGSGYYDRFLNSQPVGYKIALAFDFQVVDKIDIIEHDVPMGLIITENRTIKVR